MTIDIQQVRGWKPWNAVIATLWFAAFAVVVLPTRTPAQTIIQPRHSFDQGGGKGTGEGLVIRQSLGQPFVQGGEGGGILLGGGFFSPGSGPGTGSVTVFVGVGPGWNMVSVPLIVGDYTKTSLFPTAVSSAFAFTTKYEVRETLTVGTGYWLKFERAHDVAIAGTERNNDTIGVRRGWNLIGPLSASVAPGNVGSVPGRMIVSSFFGFEDAYVPADSLRPGRAYWVKVAEDGSLVLSSPSVPVPAADRVRIVPDDEKPPAPPEDGMAANGTGLPFEYVLHQNYPNPFNPWTEIRYDLPESVPVVLRVFNVLGEEIATLAGGVREAGYRSVRFDASGISSGVYFYRLTAGTFTAVQKMVVLK